MQCIYATDIMYYSYSLLLKASDVNNLTEMFLVFYSPVFNGVAIIIPLRKKACVSGVGSTETTRKPRWLHRVHSACYSAIKHKEPPWWFSG